MDLIIDAKLVNWKRVFRHWSWLFEKSTTFNVWILTKFGDLFVHMDDGSIFQLDTGAGTFEHIAKNKDEFGQLIDTDINLALWFMPSLISQLESQNKVLKTHQCYGFITPTGLKEGSYTIENIKIVDIEEYFIAMGDLWNHLKNIPDGTKVTLELER
ncbi:T6SS immunity protein Tdi1 domain-containing protein [candidate division CSSED10-310 bacterium]|uniref:T6SS immunity protein Tdi1 domain-containing protein n=1 Tax=candidate division CSSED10-310 bacterium TaxID=2855610 RepID=A0ABV6Z2I6_UNCC1